MRPLATPRPYPRAASSSALPVPRSWPRVATPSRESTQRSSRTRAWARPRAPASYTGGVLRSRRVRALVAAGAAGAGAAASVAGVAPAVEAAGPASSPPVWERWIHLPGVFDVAGPRGDGRLVAAVHGK